MHVCDTEDTGKGGAAAANPRGTLSKWKGGEIDNCGEMGAEIIALLNNTNTMFHTPG